VLRSLFFILINLPMNELKIWILVGVAGIMATVIGFVIKVVTAQVIKRLDEIVLELKQLTQATTIHREQIRNLQEQDAIMHRRLNEHSERIHRLESTVLK
jgi:uncharacterized membrane-anchored protein YhcB (DUF1043 family)